MRWTTGLRRLRHLSAPAACVLRIGLGLCCCLLWCALILLLRGQPYSLTTYPCFVRAAQLQQATLAVYFLTAFLTCFVEEQQLKS